MKDKLGKKLKIGDWVAFILADTQVTGVPWCGKIVSLTGITSDDITIYCNPSLESFCTYYREPKEVRKITQEETMLFLLENL